MYRLTLKELVQSVLLSVLLLTISTRMQAQTDPSSSSTPNFAPKSPEAAAFLKYGEYPVDLSTGVPGISIPLYTVDIKDFKLPISLDYHASGIKVTQEATWVGLGWNLNAGAQVVLSPRDDIDENNAYIDQIPEDDDIINYFKAHPYNQSAVLTLDPNLDKSRVKDMYVFSSPTVNGSFYIRNFVNNDVVTIPPNAFKVDLIGGNRENMTFKITDPQGNVYSLNTTEISIQSMTHSDRYISAWYVDEIKTPSNNKINFTYQDDGNLTDMTFSQKVEIKNIVTRGQCPDGSSYSSQIGAVIDGTGNTVTLLKKIKEISFNDGNSKVLFTKNLGRQDLVDGAGNGYLSKIEIQQLVNAGFQNVKGYTFEYSYFNASGSYYSDKRLKLDKVVNLFGRVEQEFVYSDVSVPNKTSKGQDYFGYNNGLVNNQDLIPKHYLSAPYPTEVGKADRTVNSIANQAGILKEIHYPTKGWTKFNYETNQYFGVDAFSKYVPVIVNSSVVQGTGGTVPINEGPGIDGVICLNIKPDDCVNYVSIPFTAKEASGQLTFTMNNLYSSDPTISKYYHARVRVFAGGSMVYDSGHWSITQSFNIPLTLSTSGTIEVEVYGKFMSVNSLQLKYVNNDPTPKNNLGAGLRISTIENYDSDNSLVLKKQYDYSDINNISNTSGQLINTMSTTFQSNTFTNYNFIQCGGEGPLGCMSGVNSTAVYSISSNSRFGIEGNSVAYKYVKEKQIDPVNQINNGFTQYEFTIEPDNIPFGNPTVQIPTTWKRGKILNKKIYKTVGVTNYIVEEEKNTYFEDASNTSFYNGFKMFRMATTNTQENPQDPLNPYCPYDANGGIDVLHSIEPITYNIPILWFYQKTSEKSSYFYNAANTLTGTLVNTTTYNYNKPSYLQLTSQTTANSIGETLETKYFYSQDPEMAGRPFAAELKAAYMIGIPLDTQTIRAGTKIAEQLTNYDKSVATSNLLLPRTVYSNKGEGAVDLNLDTKLTYDLYDDRGNVLQYTPYGGSPVSIIWGYNKTQPVAKVENVAYATIPVGTITNLQTLSNADSDNCLSASCTEQLLRNALDAFRNSLSNAFISTYTYNPLVGVTSMTDPKGITTYYEYDTYGRLRFVKDKDLNVLQKYCYNYKGENINCSDNTSTSVFMYKSIARSGSFTRNNCAAGGVASSVSYSQAVGAVISTVSQADADALGLTKFNADGQANANASGTCTFSSIARSGSFTRNNCAAGGVGSSVAFSQVAGVQISLISQADADAKGLALFNTNGQANANATGTCTFSSIAKSGSFTKNNCAAGGVGSSVAFSQVAGAQISNTSQADADAKGLTLFNTNGQANANANGTCTFSSIARSGSFTRNNCVAPAIGSSVAFSQAVGAEISNISQTDADSKGLILFNNNGQAYANSNGSCTYYNVAISKTFTRNDCMVGGTPGTYTYTVPAGKYSSGGSQLIADRLAQNDIDANGQFNANNIAECTFYSAAKSGVFVKNNCAVGLTGSSVTYSVPSRKYSSIGSQADADNLAQADVNNNGQAYANTNGVCLFNSIARSGSFIKNNCAAGGVGSSVAFSQVSGARTSTISQADADALGLTLFNTNGQANANTNGTCTFSSIARSGAFTKNNCAAGGVGSSVAFSQVVGAQTSNISQADADSKGLTLFNTNGQANANANGTCTFSSVARSGSFTKNNCAAGGVGLSVAFSQVAGAQTSTVSQVDADSLGLSKFNADGQANANIYGNCTFSSIAMSGSFTKNNCSVGGVGSSVVFSQVVGAQTSTISQADADALGLTLFNTNGQANANTNGGCTFSNAAISKTFTKNDCPGNSTPGTYTYTVPAGKYTGGTQTKVDQQAQSEIDANGQYNANNIAECTFYSAAKSGVFVKNNCASGLPGSSITYAVPARKYTSNGSQADADNLAQTDVNNNGQAYANTNGICPFISIARSGSFTKNNCGANGTGTTITYNQGAGAATSAVSQADADALGLTKFNTDGQAYANVQGNCNITFEYDRFFNSSTKQLTIDAWATGTNHNGATLNFTVNYLRLSGAAASQVVTIVFAAGEGSKMTTISLNASSLVSVSLQVIRN